MSSSRFAFAFAAALATASAAIPVVHAATAPQGESGMRLFLSPQQRAMLMMENGGQWQTMSHDDRHAAREKMRATWMAMSTSDREAKRRGLQAKWDALPQAQKDQINQRIAERAQRHGEGGDHE